MFGKWTPFGLCQTFIQPNRARKTCHSLMRCTVHRKDERKNRAVPLRKTASMTSRAPQGKHPSNSWSMATPTLLSWKLQNVYVAPLHGSDTTLDTTISTIEPCPKWPQERKPCPCIWRKEQWHKSRSYTCNLRWKAENVQQQVQRLRSPILKDKSYIRCINVRGSLATFKWKESAMRWAKSVEPPQMPQCEATRFSGWWWWWWWRWWWRAWTNVRKCQRILSVAHWDGQKVDALRWTKLRG